LPTKSLRLPDSDVLDGQSYSAAATEGPDPGDARVVVSAMSLQRRLVSEALGTSFLLIAVVGSGILGERLAGGNTAVALLANALATGAALFALIEWLAPLSGAHFNPLVTLAMAFRGDITRRAAAAYVPIQLIGAVIGVGVANAMFDAPVFSWSTHPRLGPSQWLGEFVSTFGLVGAVWTCSRMRPSSVAGVVAAYIGGAFWFTPTDFANPAVTLARALTDTFSGIRPSDVPGFIVAEIAGAGAAVAMFRWLLPNACTSAK
jgi:glycerol uptake facilitator-like aquaporin